MKRKKTIVGLGVLVVLAGLTIVWALKQRRYNIRAAFTLCRGVLKETALAVNMYSSDYDGAFPPSISQIRWIQPEWWICPGSRTSPDPTATVDEWMDYIYIHWPDPRNTPGNFPLMYDRRMSNHQGRGIHILRVQHAEHPPGRSGIFWDEDAKWLKGFAESHPELDIPLPEDLE